jgi:hypothetical protein
MITVKPAENKKALRDFVDIPNRLYAGDSLYKPQLTIERLEHLGPKNPYFKHAAHQFFIAYENGTPTGRISAQIDDLAQKNGQPKLGHFGFIDAANEQTLIALLTKAEQWLDNQGAKKITGPYSLSINDEAGLLIDGYERAPRMMMNYAPRWLGPALENAGYKKAKDLIAFHMRTDAAIPAAARRIAEKTQDHPGVHLRTLDKTHLKRDLGIILEIFNEAWAGNWGFVPMTADEITHTANNMKPLINPDLVHIAEIDGHAAAMIVALPDLNEALNGLGGRLLPLGWAKLLWRLKVKGVSGARILLMGVRPKHQSGFLGSALAVTLMNKLHEALRTGGYKDAELSWILEDNTPMIRLVENAGASPYKRYRIYEKTLA